MDYININGEEIKLKEGITKEKLKELGIIEEYNPFNVKDGETAYYINGWFDVQESDYFDKDYNKLVYYCKNKSLVEERAKEERLSRLLWKFANENNLVPEKEEIVDINTPKYYITYVVDKKMYSLNYTNFSIPFTIQLFKTREACELAIKQIVVPFMEGRL